MSIVAPYLMPVILGFHLVITDIAKSRGVANAVIEGAHLHRFVFTDHKLKQSISKEINCAEHQYMNMGPSVTDFAMPLAKSSSTLA